MEYLIFMIIFMCGLIGALYWVDSLIRAAEAGANSANKGNNMESACGCGNNSCKNIPIPDESEYVQVNEQSKIECEFLKKQLKWDIRFIELARHVSTWSKDPSTQTGAVIVDENNRLISVGYNGLPVGVEDKHERLHNREIKYKMIVHCERNAIIFSNQDLSGCTLYTWPFMSCSVCAGMVIQSGITRCVAPQIPEHLKARWEEDMKLARQMFEEAGVELVELPLELFNKETNGS